MAKTRASTTAAKPRSDAYVGLLFIALLAQIAGAVFFFLDYNQYPSNKPAAVDLSPGGPRPAPPGGAAGAAGAGGQAAGAGGMAGAAGMGGGMAGAAGMGGGMAGAAGMAGMGGGVVK